MEEIAIIGQGYVGLPLALKVAENDFKVWGIDSEKDKISMLKIGKSYIEDISNQEIGNALKSGNYIPTSDYSKLADCSVIIICVPTPLNKNNKPDYSYVYSAAKQISEYIKKDSLVILESTVEPGFTRKEFLPLLLSKSDLQTDDFYVAFSPERVDPSNKNWKLENTPKLVAGLSLESALKARQFYNNFIQELYVCDSLETAEMAKLLENSFRLINISFINEFARACHKLGINVIEVILAASTKPYGFMPFYPGIGVGGHCIPIDPLYLANKAREIGVPTRFIDLADQVNQEMPGYFVGRAEEKLGGLKGKKVLVVGVSYKPNVADVRESPVEALIAGLKQKGAQVAWHDDLVKAWNGEKSVTLSSNFDLAIIATPHDYLDLTKLENVPILNTRGSI